MEDKKMSVADFYQKMSEIGMNGWIEESEGEVIRKEVDKLEPGDVYLEIGVAYGKSLSTACYYAHPEVQMYGIDILNWKQRDETMKAVGVGGRANFIEGDSQMEAMVWDKPISLLFIDGNHSYFGVMNDLLSWLPHVKHGGRIIMHDYDRTSPGVMKAVHDFIFPHNAYTEFSFGEGPQTIYGFTKK